MSRADDIGAAASKLARRLAALPEPAMREAAMVEYLGQTDETTGAQVLEQVRRRGDLGGPPFDVALLTLTGVLGRQSLPYELISELYRASRDLGLDRLGRILMAPTQLEPKTSADVERELTLGHRKTLARQGSRDDLQRLLRNPEPEVLPHLLRNPKLTERDVVQLAARRPVNPRIQCLLVENDRWIARYGVRRAVVLNPGTPVQLGLRLLSFLMAADLKLVHTTPSLPDELRSAARSLHEERRGSKAAQGESSSTS